ncbi:MAG: HlyC/CorC family transporter [Gammaproteobacteria bacterium]|nr:HlyC/CorC family transporter [Gammaproteobacteria bacterium]
MEDIPLYALFIVLGLLFALSAFFSGSETALMTVNRYRLEHLAREGHRGAARVLKLLEKPDQLISLILLGNNLANILIAQLTAYIGYRIYGDLGIAVATAALTLALLIFAELTPKTFAALWPQRLALPASAVYAVLRVPLYPLVRLGALITGALLKPFGGGQARGPTQSLTREELRAALAISRNVISEEYQDMLVGILDLEKKTVEDIMIPRHEIIGIDLDDEIGDIEDGLANTAYTRVPLYRGSIDHVVGFVHVRKMLQGDAAEGLTIEALEKAAREPHFISKNVPLMEALRDFKKHKRRSGLIVDEYGEIQGLVTMEDLLEEIVGEFTSDPGTYDLEIARQEDGSVIVDGSCHIRELNQLTGWKLDEDGPKTVNGLVLEKLEMIPESATCILIEGHPFEVLKTHRNAVKIVRILPRLAGRDGDGGDGDGNGANGAGETA